MPFGIAISQAADVGPLLAPEGAYGRLAQDSDAVDLTAARQRAHKRRATDLAFRGRSTR